jgi:hypothetical protein
VSVPGSRRGFVLLAVGFAAALAMRAVFLSAGGVNYDTASWQFVVGILERGGRLYEETSRYNYSPLWAGVLWVLARLARPAGLSLAQAVSIFVLAVDAATAALIWRITAQRGSSRESGGLAALLFFANPLSVIVSSYRIMFDGFGILFLLMALSLMERKPAAKTSAAVSLALSLLAKHIAWFHPLLFARRREEPRLPWLLAIAPYAVFLLSFAPFWSQWRGIRAVVFGYRGLDEPYGTEFLRSVTWLPLQTTAILFVLAALASVWLLGLAEVELGRASLMLFLVVLLTTPGICPYYFVWPVALGALYPSAGYLVYTIVLTGFFIHSPDMLAQEIPHLPGWGGAWFAVLFWLLWEIRAIQRAGASRVRRAAFCN